MGRTIESVLNEVGGFGCYQVLVACLATYSRLFPAMVTYSSIFVAGKQRVRCSSHPEYFMNSSEVCSVSSINNLTGVQETVHCTNWTYDTDQYESTIISQFNLVCGRKNLVQLSTTIYFLGFLIGCIFYGLFSDKFGRIPAQAVSAAHLGTAFIASGFAPNFPVYCLFRFLSGWGTGGILTTGFTYAIEITNPGNRVWLTQISTNGWSLGILALTLVSYFQRNHVNLHIIIGCWTFSHVIFALLMKESPRWLYNTGRIKRARACLKTIARINCQHTKQREEVTAIFEDMDMGPTSNSSKTRGSMRDLLRPAAVRRNTLILWCNWLVVSMTYYAISLSVGRMGGSVYLNNIYSSLVEPVGRLCIVFLSWKLGRRVLMMSCFWLGALCLFVCGGTFGRKGLVDATIGVSMTGKFFVVSCFELIWMYTAEATPTVIRTTGLGTGSTWARAGGMLAPQIGLLGGIWLPAPFIVLGSLPLICGGLTYFLPETRGRRLPETIDDGVQFARGEKLEPRFEEEKEEI